MSSRFCRSPKTFRLTVPLSITHTQCLRSDKIYSRAKRADVVPLPRVTIEFSAADIDAQQVLWLSSKCYGPSSPGPYSASVADITKALQNSLSVVAAYSRADALPDDLIFDFPNRIRVDNLKIDSNELWHLRRSAKRQKILIGIAHAASDGVFVGTVDHVMVLPSLQKQGLGRRLMSKVCNRLLQQDVTDIGTLVPPPHEQFFSRCGFSLDKYNSVAMNLRRDAKIRLELM